MILVLYCVLCASAVYTVLHFEIAFYSVICKCHLSVAALLHCFVLCTYGVLYDYIL